MATVRLVAGCLNATTVQEERVEGAVKVLVEISQLHFDGESLLGPSLMGELDTIPVERALSTQTFEGYSVWGIVLHLLYRKYLTTQLLGGDLGREPYPYEKADWPTAPYAATASDWAKLRADLRRIHRAYLKAVAEYPPSRWEDPLSQWNCTVGNVLQYMACHDVYRLAQIRNMTRSSSTVRRPN